MMERLSASAANPVDRLLHAIYNNFFFNDTATTEIYTLSLHDALPIYRPAERPPGLARPARPGWRHQDGRSEEHTSELQSQFHLVCRLLLEKKNTSTLRRPSTSC